MSKKIHPPRIPLQKYDLTQATPQQADTILEHFAKHVHGLYLDDSVSTEQVATAVTAGTKCAPDLAPLLTALFTLAYSDGPLSENHIAALEKANHHHFARVPVNSDAKKRTPEMLMPAELNRALHAAILGTLQPARTHLREDRAGMRPSQGRITFPDLREATSEQAQRILDMCCHELENNSLFRHRADDDKYIDLISYLRREAEDLVPTISTLVLIAHPDREVDASDFDTTTQARIHSTRKIDASDYAVFTKTESAIHNHMNQDGSADIAATALKKAIFQVMKPAVNLERLGMTQSV